MSGNTDSVKDTSRFILFGVGILILVAMVFFAFRYFQEKKENDQNLEKITLLNDEILSLEEKILNFEVEFDNQSMQLVEKERELGEKDDQIEDLLRRLDEAKGLGKTQAGQIKQLRERLEQLQRFVDGYKTQVTQLETQNEALKTQVADLSANREEMEQSFTQLQTSSSITERKLEETLRVASVLKTGKITVVNVKKNGKVQDRSPIRRGALHQLNICFDVLENLVAEPGPREVYMILINPDGTTNTNYDAQESGVFWSEGVEKTYSASTNFDYARLSQEVCISYTPTIMSGKKFEKGTYYLSLFSEGNLIGQSNFKVK